MNETATQQQKTTSPEADRELNRVYEAVDTDAATRAKIDVMLAEAEASGEPIPAERVFAALKDRAADKHAG